MVSGKYIRTEEIKEKTRQSLLGRTLSDETKLKISLVKKGFKHTEETKRKIGLGHLRGKNNMWKGGRRIHCGYMCILKPDHPNCDRTGYVKEHSLVMEEYLGRYLNKEEVVHHINRNTLDNRIENLKLFATRGEHNRFHMKEINPWLYCNKKK